MKEWFNFKMLSDPHERTAGILLRLLGIDFSLFAVGWVNDWRLIDLRIPVNYGVYLQIWFLIATVGRLPTSAYAEEVTND